MISVVMPTYNQAAFLKRAIDSILAQTVQDFELIVVDDGSTDNTAEILTEYDDPRMQVWHKPNGGTGTALNMGFQWARGEYETWFASDNLMYPENLENLLAGIGDADLVYSDCEILVRGAKKPRLYSELFDSLEYDPKRCLAQGWYFGLFWLWRRELRLRSMAAFIPTPNEDFDMMLRFEENGIFRRISCVGGFVELHDECMSAQLEKSKNPNRFLNAIAEGARLRRATS